MGGIIFQIIATVIEAFLLKHMTIVNCDWTSGDSNHKISRKIIETKIGLRVWMLIVLIFLNSLNWLLALILFVLTLCVVIFFSRAIQECNDSYEYVRIDSKIFDSIVNFLTKPL